MSYEKFIASNDALLRIIFSVVFLFSVACGGFFDHPIIQSDSRLLACPQKPILGIGKQRGEKKGLSHKDRFGVCGQATP
jgi:hypothetical protein